jgi:hypothetical protein
MCIEAMEGLDTAPHKSESESIDCYLRCIARAPLLKVFRLPQYFPSPIATRMEEKRKFPRTDIEELAYVSSGGSVMRCVVRNISREGAAIDVENPAFVPQHFRLVMAKDSSIVHQCRVAWIKKNRIGLTFTDVAQESSE